MANPGLKFKVGMKVLETSGHTYDRTKALRIGTVIKMGKARMKVEFKRRDELRVEEFYIESGKKFGANPYYHHEVVPLTAEKEAEFSEFKTRMIAERTVRDADEKFREAYANNVRDDRTHKIVSTKNLQAAAELIEQALELLDPKPTKEESNAEEL